MNIKLRIKDKEGTIRLENNNVIKEILVNQDIIHPENESISICFKKKNSSGIIEISPAELEFIYQAVNKENPGSIKFSD